MMSRSLSSTRCVPPAVNRRLILQQLLSKQAIQYVPIPDALIAKYQAFTQADLTQLRAAACNSTFQTVQRGTASYVEWLLTRQLPAS